MIEVIGALIGIGLMGVLVWAIFSLIGEMARDRGHNPWAWWFLALAWSPFGSIFVMWLFFPIKDGEASEESGEK